MDARALRPVTLSVAILQGLAALKRCGECAGDRFPIADESEVRAFENHRIRIAVNRDYRLGALDSDSMIRDAADPYREIQPRSDRLARQPDLQLMRDPALVRDATRGTQA